MFKLILGLVLLYIGALFALPIYLSWENSFKARVIDGLKISFRIHIFIIAIYLIVYLICTGITEIAP